MCHFSFAAFNIFFSSLTFSILLLCLFVGLFAFILFGVCSKFPLHAGYCFSIIFRKIVAIIYSYIFLLLSLFYLFWDSHYMIANVLNSVPHLFEALFLFLHFLLCSLVYIMSIYHLSSNCPIISSAILN